MVPSSSRSSPSPSPSPSPSHRTPPPDPSLPPWVLESFARGRQMGAVVVHPAALPLAEIPQFVFTHLPKTGGLTLRAAFIAICAFNGWSWEEIRGGPTDAIADYRARTPAALQDARFIAGHLPFGLHDARVPHIALLRDPVQLILSMYAMGAARGAFPVGASLAGMFEANTCFDNLQTRLLSGLPEQLVPGSICTEEVFNLARDNLLNRYVVAADVERFDDFLAVMLAAVRAPAFLYFRKNIRTVDLPDHMVAAFTPEARDRARFDAALFEAVKGRVRLGLPLKPEVAMMTPGCLAFKDEEGYKFLHDAEGPARFMMRIETQGVPVKQHICDTSGLEVRS